MPSVPPVAPKLSPEAFYVAIAENIAQDITACKALIDLLQQEREHLMLRQVDALDDIVQAKTQWLSQLETSAHTRSQWLAQTPLNPAENPAKAWQVLLTQLNKPDLTQQWQALKGLLQTCQDENAINGKLITRNQTTFNKLVDILRGQDTLTPLYSGKGGKLGAYTKQMLGEA